MFNSYNTESELMLVYNPVQYCCKILKQMILPADNLELLVDDVGLTAPLFCLHLIKTTTIITS